jgi:hypothetical protein
VCLLANSITHPLFWWAVDRTPGPAAVAIPIGEAAVTLVEAAAYRLAARSPLPAALLLSVVANLFSWFVGAMLLAADFSLLP